MENKCRGIQKKMYGETQKKKHSEFQWRIIISGISSALLLALYCIIFSFSDQDSEQSGSLSLMLSEKCVEFLNALTGKNWSEVFMEGLAVYFEHPIRKIAHFAEYAVMGILMYGVLRPWIRRGKKLYFVIGVWLFLSAASDEIHQLFVPGRYGSFWDVLLDLSGGLVGMFCLVWAEMLRRRMFLKSRQKHENTSKYV